MLYRNLLKPQSKRKTFRRQRNRPLASSSMQSERLAQTLPTPRWFYRSEIWTDDHPTVSSELQENAAEQCLPLLIDENTGDSILSPLERSKHIRYLHNSLTKRLVSAYVALDASRPWQYYWCLTGLSALGQDVSKYRQSLIETLEPIHNRTGGFGGGQSQYSHLATTYASVLSLVSVGGAEALKSIDRRAMWHWLGSLKLPAGNFEVCKRGESDVRGAYCAMVILSLLNLPLELPPSSPARGAGLETFLDGLPEWISSCQTFEGGITNFPGSEAHAAYTFCGLACLCIIGKPYEIMPRYLDMAALMSWLSARQHAPEGGLTGRTNKVVDGCYSHWLGGCWSLVESAVYTDFQSKQPPNQCLWNREALIRYILCCCQANRGGLRDKPSAAPDPYHTCYNLVGLSAAQNYYYYEDIPNEKVSAPLTAAFKWKGSKMKSSENQIFDEGDRVSLIHPVYVIPWGAAEKTRAYFEENAGF